MEGDKSNGIKQKSGAISIHSLRVEGDIKRWALTEGEDISIHSLRVEGDRWYLCAVWTTQISIHSLRVEGDLQGQVQSQDTGDFNPLPPCGGRLDRCIFNGRRIRFQSTPSVWRETLFHHQGRRVDSISIHSLRVEGDKFLV